MSDRRAKTMRALRYLAPNLITATGLSFGMLSLVAAFEGNHIESAWFIMYAVLTDRLDGFVARLVRGTSELGVQLDSLADFLTFGICPAVLVFTSIGGDHGLPAFQHGAGRYVLMASCASWIFGAVFRLARYNIQSENEGTPKIFFGIPTTMAAGLLVVWYLAFAKYAVLGAPMAPGASFSVKLLGDGIVTPVEVWRYFPLAMFVGGAAMASSLRMPKLGLMQSRPLTVFVFANVLAGYVCGFGRVMPEYLILPPTTWLVVFLVWGAASREARAMRPPLIFPPVDPPPGKEPIRPEDDLLREGDDTVLDGDGNDPADGGPHSRDAGVNSSTTPTG